MNFIDPKKHMRTLEFCLVLFIAVLPLMTTSIFSLINKTPQFEGALRNLQILHGILIECSAIALLIYILFRQNRRLSDIGFSFRMNDIWHSIILALACILALFIVYFFYSLGHYLITGNHFHPVHPVTILDGKLNFFIIIFVLLNPFFEELIVRAFTITEVEYLTNSTVNAIAFSVFIQTVYHLYQGLPNAIVEAGTFLLLSLYYAKFRRIAPVIMVHGYFDILSLIFSAMR
jgi:membrane protease YdiL (CAAX protease family)